MTDCHNHLQQFCQPAEILREAKAAGVTHQIVNGTCEADWPQVVELSLRHTQSIIPAFGLHPWEIAGRSSSWLIRLRRLLEAHPTSILGECGLDRWKTPFDLDAQLLCFGQQLELAQELKRPLTIHCLKAWGPLHTRLSLAGRLPPFLLHSYAGSAEMIPRFVELGAFFSFSGYFLHERKVAQREVFRLIPPERLLIETDAPAMAPPRSHQQITLSSDQNHPANLIGFAAELAKLRGLPKEVLAELLKSNLATFLSLDIGLE